MQHACLQAINQRATVLLPIYTVMVFNDCLSDKQELSRSVFALTDAMYTMLPALCHSHSRTVSRFIPTIAIMCVD